MCLRGVFLNSAKLLQPSVNWASKLGSAAKSLTKTNEAGRCMRLLKNEFSGVEVSYKSHPSSAPLIDLFACPHLHLLLNSDRASRRSRLIFCCLVSRKKGCSVLSADGASPQLKERGGREGRSPTFWTDIGPAPSPPAPSAKNQPCRGLKRFFPGWKSACDEDEVDHASRACFQATRLTGRHRDSAPSRFNPIKQTLLRKLLFQKLG